MIKRIAAGALALALVLGAPGLPAYQAAAQAVRASGAATPVPQAAGWGQAMGSLFARLERDPALANGSAGLLRTLGHLRLELALSPRSPGALALVHHLPSAVACDPVAFSKLEPAAQAGLAAAAAHAAAGELREKADALLARAREGELTAGEKAEARAIAGAWFYLPPETAGEFRKLARESAKTELGLARRIARGLGSSKEETAAGAAAHEARNALRGAERLTLARPTGDRAQSERLVRDLLAPAAARALDLSAERAAERGHGADSIWLELLKSHDAVFGRLAGRELVQSLRKDGVWTDFVSALTLHAADRLSASPSPEADKALREAGASSDLRFRLPSWDPRSETHATVADLLAETRGPAETPAWLGKRVATLAGIPFHVTPKFPRLLGVMLASFMLAFRFMDPGFGLLANAGQAIASTALMIGGVLAHELGHAWTAKAHGEKVIALVLTGKGGGAAIDSSMRRGRVEALVAAVGPIVTLAFAAACLLAAQWLPGNLGWLASVLTLQGWFNLMGVVMNGLPMPPNDGGRVLRGLLNARLGDHYRATRIASNVGVAMVLLLAAIAIPVWLTGNGLVAAVIAGGALTLIPGVWKQRFHPGTRLVDEGSPADGRKG